MPRAAEIKKADVICVDGKNYKVVNIDVRSPSSRGAATLYKIRGQELRSKAKLELSCKGDEALQIIDVVHRQVCLSYLEGDSFVFMDNEDYNQFYVDKSAIEEQIPYIVEGDDSLVLVFVDGQAIGLDLPASVVLQITDTAPAVKGSTAAGRTKPATLNSGIEIQVPEYLAPGEKIKISTSNTKFVSRAN